MTQTEQIAIEDATKDSGEPRDGFRDELRDRSQQCYAEIQSALERHRCRLVPILRPEQVGSGPPTKMMVTASYGIEAVP